MPLKKYNLFLVGVITKRIKLDEQIKEISDDVLAVKQETNYAQSEKSETNHYTTDVHEHTNSNKNLSEGQRDGKILPVI